jgi:hypothetical protein
MPVADRADAARRWHHILLLEPLAMLDGERASPDHSVCDCEQKATLVLGLAAVRLSS